jgi:hypothetical protein
MIAAVPILDFHLNGSSIVLSELGQGGAAFTILREKLWCRQPTSERKTPQQPVA